MQTIYLNMKTPAGIETVDEFTREENQSPKEFRKYVNTMIQEYNLCNMYVYKSIRSTREWKNK